MFGGYSVLMSLGMTMLQWWHAGSLDTKPEVLVVQLQAFYCPHLIVTATHAGAFVFYVEDTPVHLAQAELNCTGQETLLDQCDIDLEPLVQSNCRGHPGVLCQGMHFPLLL